MKMSLSIPVEVEDFMKAFREKGFEIYIVGGPVRDLILGREIHNWDFTTNATPEQIQSMSDKAVYNNSYGTVIIPVEFGDGDGHANEVFEVTPYRKESEYTDFRHPEKIEWATSIHEDLQRRDFTINAMAYDGVELIDDTNGLADLKAAVIKAVGDPEKRFQEDALRLMRTIRFATQLGFMIENETWAALQKKAELISHISWERIRDEFLKIVGAEQSTRAADGVLLLKSSGLLQYILPELLANFGVEQASPGRHHIYDVGTHLIETLRNCPAEDPITRFAALIHDIGKAKTARKEPDTGTITFYNHELVGANIAERLAERFRLSHKQKEKLVTLVRWHMFSVSEIQTDSALRRIIRRVGIDNIRDILDIRYGDRVGSGAKATSWRTELFKKRLEEVQHEPFAVKDLKINGHDVMTVLEMKPSRQIGDILEEIFNEVFEGKLKNEREPLLERLAEFKDTGVKDSKSKA